MTTTSNPLEMDYAGIVEWAKSYIKNEKEQAHILDNPSPVLLTTYYAQAVVEGSVMASKWVKLACERHLKDLEKSKNDPDYPWAFDEEKAHRPIRFIEKKCKPSKGDYDHLVLQPWQHFFVGNIFGWVNREAGYRRYREALVFLGRKNGKVISPF
ncbi:terminase large subunit domain-containing protein [Limosilactobacillus gastricus]|nr:terminase large subunit [Limosilactobacillus gastricus]